MKSIGIASLLSPDLKSRTAVSDLLMYVKSMRDNDVRIDFANVQFATRSFMDEYYNTFVDDHGQLGDIRVESVNLPDDIKYMLNVVSQTQTGKKIYADPANTTIHKFDTVAEMLAHMKTMCV